jgi:HSP20 family protein
VNEKSSDTEKKNSEASGRGALAEFREAIGGLFESVVGMAPDFGIGRDWPRHELIVDDDAYRVQVELPGFSREEIEVSVAGRTLTVSGDRKKFAPPEGARLLRSERPSGSFELDVRLPAEVDALSVVAQMHDGVLEISLPKASSRGRSIDIEETESGGGAAKVKKKSAKTAPADDAPWEEDSASGSADAGEEN